LKQVEMKYVRLGLVLSGVVMLMQGCYMDNAEDLYGASCGIASIPAEAILFEEDIRPIIEANCSISGCHAEGNGTGRVELIDRQKVSAAIEFNDLKGRIVNRSMPLGGELSSCDEEALLLWIDHNFPTI